MHFVLWLPHSKKDLGLNLSLGSFCMEFACSDSCKHVFSLGTPLIAYLGVNKLI